LLSFAAAAAAAAADDDDDEAIVCCLQLKHLFSGKYIHMSTDRASGHDKNNLKV